MSDASPSAAAPVHATAGMGVYMDDAFDPKLMLPGLGWGGWMLWLQNATSSDAVLPR